MAQQNRAWSFGYPGIDVPEEEAGIRTSLSGCIEMIEEPGSVRQAVLLLLSTRRGERVMRPEYGCDLHRLVFLPNDDTTAGLAIHYVRKAVEAWEPRIEILKLDASQCPEDAGRLDVVLEYRVRTTQGTERVVYPVYLTEG